MANLYYYEPVSITPTTIVFKTNLVSGSGKISVFANGNTAISAVDFTAIPDSLKVEPKDTSNGQLGRQMYISAGGLNQLTPADTNRIFVSFGGTTPVKANYLSSSLVTAGAIVPRYAQAGKITLIVDNRRAISTIDFPLHMSMRDFSPKILSRGDTMKITGVGFTNINDMVIDFNRDYGTVTRPFLVTPTEMWVKVPSFAQTGYLEISANYGTITDVFYDQKFQLR